MKTVNNIFKHTFFCLALGTTVCSCDLDVEPTSSIATETFWTSEKDAWYNLNAVYSASIPGAAVHSDSYTNDAILPIFMGIERSYLSAKRPQCPI